MDRAVLVTGDFVRTGGMDMPNYAVAERLADCGVSVQLVAFRVAEELRKHSNITWRRVPKPLRSYSLGLPLLDLAGRFVGERCLAQGGRVIVNGGNCNVGDVNWVHYVHAAYRPTTAVPRSRVREALMHRLNVEQERRALTSARVVIANSNRTRRDLIDQVGVEASRIHTVYYGIDSERFSPPTESRRRELRLKFGFGDNPQIAFIGALGDRRKGFDTLFDAWGALARDPAWDCDLVVVGRGSELGAWQGRMREAGLEKRMRFLGFRSDVPDILAACDALVAPTRYEAYGLGVQEALCTGLPAIVSADAGVAERYPSELGELLLTLPAHAGALESSMRDWRRHHERLRARTLSLATELRSRTWRVMADEVRTLLA